MDDQEPTGARDEQQVDDGERPGDLQLSGIVVGVDGSENSLDALRWAASDAAAHSCELHVVGTYSTPIMTTGYEVAVLDPSDLAAAVMVSLEEAVEVVRSEGRLTDIDVGLHAVEGHAGERLISASAGARQLVVGARGHGGFLGLLLGSVTNYVVGHDKCPVTVVPHRG